MISLFKPFVPESVINEVSKTLRSGWLGQGEKVDEFEAKFSKTFDMKNVISLNTGTSAIRLALSLIGVKPNDEVITTPYTAVPTNTAILEQFAKPIFADIRYETANINPSDIEHRITKKTKAIICVHWGGYPCDMDELHKISNDYKIPIIEDAAQALGAKYKNQYIGNISPYTIFSFQSIKHLTTIDGGILIVKDDAKYKEAIRRRWYGIDRDARKPSVLSQDETFDIKEAGFKYHMNDVVATMGIEQLNYFKMVSSFREEIASKYRSELKNIDGVTLLKNSTDRVHANWMFAFHVKERLKFATYMRKNGIEAGVHNWRNDQYSIFGGLRKDLPNIDKLNSDLICIPIHMGLSEKDTDYIIDTIKKYFQ